jgi:hypothetical protein
MNQPPMNQPPMNQPPMNQPPMNQPPMNQPPMNQPAMVAGRYSEADEIVVESVSTFDFSELEIRVLLLLRSHSFKVGRSSAIFTKLLQIAAFTGIPENKVRGVIDRLISMAVVKVFDRDGDEVRGKAIAKRGHRYAILVDRRFWGIRLRYNLTPDLEDLRRWLLGLNPDDPDPKQPWLIGREASMVEALQDGSAINISPTPHVSPVTDGVGRLNRTEPVQDAGPGLTGGEHRESVGSVPGHQAVAEPGPKAPAPLPPRQHIAEKTSEQIHSADLAGQTSQPPKKGASDLPKREVGQENPTTSQKGRLLDSPDAIEESGQPPFWGCFPLKSLEVSGVSTVSVPHSKTTEALKGECKGGRVRPARRDQAETAFMARLRHFIGDEAVGWGGFWRRRWQSVQHRQLIEQVLERLEIRLGSRAMAPIGSPGGWMRSEYKRGLRLYGLADLPRKE